MEGEFLATAKVLGIPHPPGYPTYVLLLKAFTTLVPFGDFAYRGNLLSALLASASVFVLYWVTIRFCRAVEPNAANGYAVIAAALGALTFAASPLVSGRRHRSVHAQRPFPGRVVAHRRGPGLAAPVADVLRGGVYHPQVGTVRPPSRTRAGQPYNAHSVRCPSAVLDRVGHRMEAPGFPMDVRCFHPGPGGLRLPAHPLGTGGPR